jgi:RNA polymerase sigma-70 factor, ECF subfamily
VRAGGRAGEILGLPLGVSRGPEADGGAGFPAAGDEALASEVARGSAAAFEVLFERYRDRVFQFVLWQLDADRDVAEELTQEIFYQLYRSVASFRRRSRFRTWLYSLARNVCRQYQRKHRSAGRGRAAEGGEAGLLLPDGRPDPLERLTAAELQARVRRAVESLPPAQRAVLVLRDWDGLSYLEISRVLGIPLGTVRSRLHHARSALATALGAGEEDRRGL